MVMDIMVYEGSASADTFSEDGKLFGQFWSEGAEALSFMWNEDRVGRTFLKP